MAVSRSRPVKEAVNRLARFNGERDAIVTDVERRVVEARLAEAGNRRDASLEYVLNDVAFQEIRRLERGLATGPERKSLGAWKDLARRLGKMTDDEKRARLAQLVGDYA